MPSEWVLVLRLLLATGLAGILGIERELSGQPAGFRTHALVGLGSVLFALTSAYGFNAIAGEGPQAVIRADPTRIASQIVVGIGFLGGGAIIKYGANVRGLTTAASLWLTAAVGLAVGIGMPLLAVATTLVALVTLVALRPLRGLLRRLASSRGELTIETRKTANLETVRSALRGRGVRVIDVEIDGNGNGHRTFEVLAELPKGIRAKDLVADLEQEDGIKRAAWNQ